MGITNSREMLTAAALSLVVFFHVLKPIYEDMPYYHDRRVTNSNDLYYGGRNNSYQENRVLNPDDGTRTI